MNEYTDSVGVRYVAEPSDNPCGRCAHLKHSINCDFSPPCVGKFRTDGQNIAWIAQEPKQ